MRSMTGQGLGRAVEGGSAVEVELRAVNHKNLELKVYGDGAAALLTAEVAEALRPQLSRGHVTCWVRVSGPAAPGATLDHARAEAAWRELGALAESIGQPVGPAWVPLLAAVPGLFVDRNAGAAAEGGAGALGEVARNAAVSAFARFDAARLAEGAALASDMLRCADRLEAALGRIDVRSAAAVTAAQARRRERVEKLLSGTGVSADPARLEQEIAILADRGDIHEERVRLRAHLGAFRACLAETAEAHGRRLDVLLQEMLRETHTIGSKASDLEITRAVIELKTELSRLKEQAQNVL